jgi:hypothetical protein
MFPYKQPHKFAIIRLQWPLLRLLVFLLLWHFKFSDKLLVLSGCDRGLQFYWRWTLGIEKWWWTLSLLDQPCKCQSLTSLDDWYVLLVCYIYIFLNSEPHNTLKDDLKHAAKWMILPDNLWQNWAPLCPILLTIKWMQSEDSTEGIF